MNNTFSPMYASVLYTQKPYRSYWVMENMLLLSDLISNVNNNNNFLILRGDRNFFSSVIVNELSTMERLYLIYNFYVDSPKDISSINVTQTAAFYSTLHEHFSNIYKAIQNPLVELPNFLKINNNSSIIDFEKVEKYINAKTPIINLQLNEDEKKLYSLYLALLNPDTQYIIYCDEIIDAVNELYTFCGFNYKYEKPLKELTYYEYCDIVNELGVKLNILYQVTVSNSSENIVHTSPYIGRDLFNHILFLFGQPTCKKYQLLACDTSNHYNNRTSGMYRNIMTDFYTKVIGINKLDKNKIK